MLNSIPKTPKHNADGSELTVEVKFDVNSEVYQRLQFIQRVEDERDISQILLGCVNIAYLHCYVDLKDWDGLSQVGQNDPPQVIRIPMRNSAPKKLIKELGE